MASLLAERMAVRSTWPRASGLRWRCGRWERKSGRRADAEETRLETAAAPEVDAAAVARKASALPVTLFCLPAPLLLLALAAPNLAPLCAAARVAVVTGAGGLSS